MIRIKTDPTIVAPEVLSDPNGQGPSETKANRVKIAADRAAELTFKSNIYAHPEVKSALIKACHEKCSFCESKCIGTSYGDVEHFRPKAGYRQTDQSSLMKPGYYWLAYDWDNLLFSCQICNQRYKKNLFPLADETKRAQLNNDNESLEEPNFIDPSHEDPAKHIEFREDLALPVNGSVRGSTTIRGLGLNRDALRESRAERLRNLKAILTMLKHYLTVASLYEATLGVKPDLTISPNWIDQRAKLTEMVGDTSEYALMCRNALRDCLAANPELANNLPGL